MTMRITSRIETWVARRRTARRLGELDRHLRADIGLTVPDGAPTGILDAFLRLGETTGEQRWRR